MYAKLLKRVVGFGLVPGVLTVGGVLAAARSGVLPLTQGWALIGLANVGGVVAYASGGRAIPGSDVKSVWHDDEEDPLERWELVRIGLLLYFLTVCLTAAALLVSGVRL